METITISKTDLQLLLCDIIFTENDIDIFVNRNKEQIDFNKYINAKKRFNIVIKKIENIIENEK